jgi:hypothetical protein
VDIKKLRTSELVMLGGAVLVFIGTFLKWFKIKGTSIGTTGFDYFLQGTIPWLLAVAVAVVVCLKAFAPNVKFPPTLGPLNWAQVYLIACGVAALLILTRILSVDGGSTFVDRGIGLFIAALGGVAMAVGAFLKFQAKEEDGAVASGPGPGTAPPTPF